MPFDEPPSDEPKPSQRTTGGQPAPDEFELGSMESKARAKRAAEKTGETHDEPLTVERENVNPNIGVGSQDEPEMLVDDTMVGRPKPDMPEPEETGRKGSDSGGGRFTIDSSTGVVTVADSSSIDYETAPNHDITVQVTDSGGFTHSETVTINVARPAVNEKTDSYKAAVESHAPVAYWRLDDEASGSTSTATDETGSHNGTHHDVDYLRGGPFSGISTKASLYDGHSDYTVIPHSDSFDLSGGTIQLWFNADTPNDGIQHTLATMNNASNTAGNFTVYVDGGKIYVDLQDGTTTHRISGGTVTAHQWHQVAFTFGPGGMELYLDGTLIGSDSYTGGIGNSNRNPLVIGTSTGNSNAGETNNLGSFFDGEIAEVSLHGTRLTKSQIDSVIDAGVNGNDPVSGTVNADTLSGGTGHDVLFGGAGADTLDGGGGDNRLSGGIGNDTLTGEAGTDNLYGGTGGGSPGSHGSDWTVNLTSGTIDATGGNYLDLSDDAAGTITLQDGSQVSFEGIERIEW